jgi:hypothetical protein
MIEMNGIYRYEENVEILGDIYIYSGLFFWRNMPERRSGTYLREQNSKKAKINNK